MKTSFSAVFSLLLAFGSYSAHSATLNWTNTASGVWNIAANWNPNAAPGPGDTAIITIPGVTVSLNSGTTVSGIILGTNGVGTVTLSLAGQTLVVNGPLTVNPSGSFTVDSGALSGNATISGVVNWTGGTFGIGNYGMTIAANGTVILAGTNGGNYILSESVTNAGTVRMQSGNLQIDYCGGGQFGKFVNLPGALVDMTTDVSIGIDGCSPGFVNQGIVRKSGGTGTNNITGTFITIGTVDAQTGAISLNGSDSGSGLFIAATGATVVFSSGTFVLTGDMTSSNALLAGATLSGNGVINGVLTWTSGTFGTGNNALTIATNAMLILAGTNGGNYVLSESVTNAGIIRVQSGNLQIDYCGGGQFGAFINLPGALVDMAGDVGIGHDGCGMGIINQGTVRKSGGTGTNNITGVFVNTGTVDAQTGTISFNGTDSGGGLFAAEPGATLAFSSGTFTLTGNLISSNAVLAGATLSGNGVINGVLTWTSGTFGTGNNAMTIATNAMLILAGTNGGNYLISQAVTNAGTVRVQSGNLQIDYCGGGQYGTFVNLPGALVDMTADVGFGDDGCGPGIINMGTVRKSGGTGINNITGVFVNTGTVDAQIGAISFNGADSGGGLFAAEPGATLAFSSGTFTLTGNMTSSNAILAGATLSGNGTINGVLTWTSGIFGTGNNALTIATNALLVLAGTNGGNYLIAQAVTNAGIVRVQSGNLQIMYCGGGQYGTFINLPGALVDMTGDVGFGDDICGPGIINMGTVRKSGGTGTNYIAGGFMNSGTIDVQNGSIALQGAYTLANGTRMSFGLGGPAGNGSISLSGATSFAGSLSVNLNNSFVPGAGSFFNLLNYTSESGVLFTNTVLPAGIIWQTNYYPTAFVLTVINTAQPTLLISTLNGTNLLLQWPADHTGWRLQAQTNPVTVGLYTNWATVSGSGVTNQIFIPVDKKNGAVFFRLIDP